jgi:hypothetical protein
VNRCWRARKVPIWSAAHDSHVNPFNTRTTAVTDVTGGSKSRSATRAREQNFLLLLLLDSHVSHLSYVCVSDGDVTGGNGDVTARAPPMASFGNVHQQINPNSRKEHIQ